MTKKVYKELSSFHEQRYGQWAGNEAGRKADPACCCETVTEGFLTAQCRKPRGKGPEEAYCGVHDPVAVKARRDKQDEIFERRMMKLRIEDAGKNMLPIIELIAAGHNDPRTLCVEFLSANPKLKSE